MTHAHDSTLLARLGFADPDRRFGLHDAACQYLTQPEIMAKIVAMVPPHADIGKKQTDWTHPDGRPDKKTHTETVFIEEMPITISGHLEVQITKGDGRYRSTIGFADVVIECLCKRRESWREKRPGEEWAAEKDHLCPSRITVVIEVKANVSSSGDVLRQLSLYREFFTAPVNSEIQRYGHNEWSNDRIVWLLATCYPISARDAEALAIAKVMHVQLDPVRAEAWAKAKDEVPYVARTI